MTRSFRHGLATIATLCTLAAAAELRADSGTVSAMAPWEGQGRLFQIGPNRVLFTGAYSGILYVQSGEGELDALLMLCPGTQEIDLDDGTTISAGYCSFESAEGDRVFAKWNCAGEVGACTGRMILTGGTGEFEGISGSGEMVARTVLADMAASLDSGSVIRSAAGLAVWPELTYRIPEK